MICSVQPDLVQAAKEEGQLQGEVQVHVRVQEQVQVQVHVHVQEQVQGQIQVKVQTQPHDLSAAANPKSLAIRYE